MTKCWNLDLQSNTLTRKWPGAQFYGGTFAVLRRNIKTSHAQTILGSEFSKLARFNENGRIHMNWDIFDLDLKTLRPFVDTQNWEGKPHPTFPDFDVKRVYDTLTPSQHRALELLAEEKAQFWADIAAAEREAELTAAWEMHRNAA